jgi:20S proteasome subunit alpha 7
MFCLSNRYEYGGAIPIKYMKERVSMYMHAHTLYSFVRPFGASMLVGTWDEFDGPQLYCLEPSGHSYGYLGVGIGKAKQAAKTEIEKLKLGELTCEQLIKEAAKIIYMVHDEIKDKQFELELSWVGEFTKGKHELVPKAQREAAEQFAKEALRPDSDSEDENI